MARLIFVLPLLALATSATAQPCPTPTVMFVLDRSSSMLDRVGDGTKWSAALDALDLAGTSLEDRAELGLQVFPFPDRCAPGEVVLEPDRWSSAALLEAVGEQPTPTGSYTPMAETLDVLATYAPLLDPDGDAHVVLITDGWQWCHPYERSTRFDPVASVLQLRDLGMTVHVVGFGVGVDVLALGRAAVAGGAPREGCDPTLTGPGEAGHCYHQAMNAAELRDIALRITSAIGAEVCNGTDDDCDGHVDEGFDADGDGFTTCGFDCDDESAEVHPGAIEACDGRDTDCDGNPDVGCACTEGELRPCSGSRGICGGGWQLCTSGHWSVCEGGRRLQPERCDGLDEDCDGTIDEQVRCDGGELCLAGVCTPLDLPEPVSEKPADEAQPEGRPAPGSLSPGCACDTANSSAPVHAMLMLLGWIGLRRGGSLRLG